MDFEDFSPPKGSSGSGFSREWSDNQMAPVNWQTSFFFPEIHGGKIDRIAFEQSSGELNLGHDQNLPRQAVRDASGNLSRYSIGPENDSSNVTIAYADAKASPAIVDRIEIKRANGETIVYKREKDPGDPDSPSVYSETRNNGKSDLLFAGLDVEKDGRVNVYLDFDHKRKALSFNPSTGEEEYL